MEDTETLNKLMDFLYEYTNKNWELVIGLCNPLKKEWQQKQMYDYVIKYQKDKERMREDRLIYKALTIAGVKLDLPYHVEEILSCKDFEDII